MADALFGISVPFEQFLIVMAVAFFLMMILIYFVYNWIRFCPEFWTIVKGRKGDRPILDITDPSGGNSEVILGKKDANGAPVFKNTEHGMKIDPGFSGNAMPERWRYGLSFYHFSKNYPTAITTRNAMARITTRDHIRDKYKDLNYISDEELMTLVGTTREKLPGIARIFVEKYIVELTETEKAAGMNPGTVSDSVTAQLVNDMVDKITKIQDEVSKIPVKDGPFSFSEAFKLFPGAFLSQDLHSIVLYTERITHIKDKKLLNIMTIAIAFFICCVGAGVLFYVLFNFGPK